MSGQIRNIVRIVALFLLLLLPIFYALFTAVDLEYSWVKKIAYLTVVVVLLLLPAIFLKARTYFIVEGIFNFFFCPIDIASLYLNHRSTSVSFLEIILYTNKNEAVELLSSIWMICIVVIILWIIYFVLASRVGNTYLLGKRMQKVLYILIPSFGIIGFVLMLGFNIYMYPTKDTKSMIVDSFYSVKAKFYKIYPYNLYLELYDIARNNYHQHQMQKQIESFCFNISKHIPEQPALYILVIGETARYDHFGINGYSRTTTPLLSQVPNLISYDSMYTQANFTSYSIPLLLTRATADEPEEAYKERSISEAFQEAGYCAGFISKQVPSNLTRRIMRECEYAHSYTKGIDEEDNYDEEMIEQLANWQLDTAMFVIMHSLGCHFRYEWRYPADFALYQPTLGKTFSYLMIAEENKDKLVNAYDNAILYTDYFLYQLINYMDRLNRPAMMLYISDHGESFWDDERKLSLHGAYEISEYEYHVPMFVWYSDEYAAIYPNKVQAMQHNKTTPISSDVVFYSLLDLADIEDIVDSTRSIASESLLPMDTIWVQTGSGERQKMALR